LGEFSTAEGFEEGSAEADEHDEAPETTPSFATHKAAAVEPPPRVYTEEPAAPDVHLAPEPEVAKAPATSDEAERAPVAYNVPPPHEVSGPTSNPRKGWWRRLTK
jgi:ribonuclease E